MTAHQRALKGLILPCSIALLALGTTQVAAQDEDDITLEEVLVTAQKRSESLQDVAISVTAITSETLDNFQIRTFSDYIRLVPGLSTSNQTSSFNAGPAAVGLRGVQSNSGSFLAGQNTVGFYIDNTPVPFTNPRLIDLERIEVLRGPQGTLYGSAALAGTIKLITRRPNYETYEAMAFGKWSDTKWGSNNWAVEGLLNIPFSDQFAVRISAYHEELGGYIDRHNLDPFANPTGEIIKDHNGSEQTGGRIVAAWRPTDRVELTFTYMTEDTDRDGNDWLHGKRPGGGPDVEPGLTFNALGIGAPNYGPLDGDELNSDYKDPIFLGHAQETSYNGYDLYNLDLNWQFDNFQIVGNFSKWKDEFGTELDTTEFYGILLDTGPEIKVDNYNDRNDEVTVELRMESTWDRPVNYTIGLFWREREEFYFTRFFAGEGSTVFGFPNTDGYVFYSDSDRDRDEKAIFAQVSWDINDAWRIVGGARVFEFDFYGYDNFIGNPLFVQGGNVELEAESKVSDWVPMAKIEWRPSDGTLVYGSYSEGFRMGGVNFPLPDNPACEAEVRSRTGTYPLPLGYEPDYLDAIELGLKKSWANGRVNTNFAIFWQDWTDTQVFTGTLCGLNGAVINAGEAKSDGVEWEITAAVTDQFTIGFGGSYINAEYTEDAQPPGADAPLAVKGATMPDIPEWSWNIIADWTFPMGDAVSGFLRGDLSYRDETVRTLASSTNLDTGSITDDYHQLNLRAGILWNSWEFTVFAENATNEGADIYGRPSLACLHGFRCTTNMLRPRTIGVSARWMY